MKAFLLTIFILWPATFICSAEPALKDADAIKQALTKPLLIPKGMDSKSARVRAREARHIDLQAIHFKFDSTEIADNESYQQLAALGKVLADAELKNCVVTLEGHTDDVGEVNYNIDLSKRRAEALKTLLVTQHHIDASRLQTVGKGKAEPLVQDTTDFARSQNRRVTVIREP